MLKALSVRALLRMLPEGEAWDGESREPVVRAFQLAHGLEPDGIPGQKTLHALWMENQPTRSKMLDRAIGMANSSGPIDYSMTKNTGMGQGWFPDPDWYPTGDCSDFFCHLIDAPKDQTGSPRITTKPIWLGTDAIASGAIGPLLDLDSAKPGDFVAYGGTWHLGKRISVGHIEMVLEVKGGRIITIGCASGNVKRHGTAVAKADKTELWHKKQAKVVRPFWLM